MGQDVIEVPAMIPAMNTTIEILIYPHANTAIAGDALAQTRRAESAVQKIATLFADVEKCLSRFLPDSALSRLNRDGYSENPPALLWHCVSDALHMARITGGIFDPTILPALRAAGYSESFERLGQSHLTQTALIQFSTTGRYQEVTLDPATHTIRLPYGGQIDLGGIAKGMTVDMAVHLLRQEGFVDFMVNAGGDIYVSGRQPERAKDWCVNVENPITFDGNLTYLAVTNAAIATSAVTCRRWVANGKERNHLIDPRTGQSVANGLASVTVIAPTAQQADVLAKTALILGPNDGQRFIEKQPNCTALFVSTTGQLQRTRRIPEIAA